MALPVIILSTTKDTCLTLQQQVSLFLAGMKRLSHILTVLLLMQFGKASVYGQITCNTPGQNPTSAFPVCGTSVFIQSSVNLCGGRVIPNPRCNSFPYDDRNPYYYKFTCFETGTLGFTITPNNASSDYDWQVFDITGRNPNDIFTDVSLTIASNWSGNAGETGTSANASSLHECDGFSTSKYSMLPTITKGRDYLLMISHFTNTQAGYKLEFKGGTAVITDSTEPQMKELKVGCGGTQFYLKLNKKMKCSSIAADGSDWEFFNANVPIASAVGVGCANGFETDSVIITAVNPVPAGSFALRSKKGKDGNTMLDLCDAPLPEGQTLVVNVLPPSPTRIDSIQKVSCKPSELELVMKDPIQCSSIAADGSDFVITGPVPVPVAGAVQANCLGGLTKSIRIQLASPIQVAGTYTVTIRQGSDGNTLINQCSLASPAGDSKTVTGYDTVSARFGYAVSSSCTADTVRFVNAGGNGINSWQWTEDGNRISNQPGVQRIYSTNGNRTIILEVSNGVCTDSAIQVFSTAATRVKAAFEYPEFACPNDTVVFTDKSTGPVIGWQWNFGNGFTSTLKNPPPQYFSSAAALSSVPVKLVVYHANGCSDSVTHRIQVPNNCYIAVPNAFTPNGDGLNDFLYPLNAWKATALHFRVYNRYGQLIWETRDWTRKWDGRMNGKLLDTGTYVWMLEYTDGDNGKKVSLKGTTVLIR